MARAAFLANEADSGMAPLAYRVPLMLPSVYRLWGKIRLAQLQPWIAMWALPQIYAVIEGQGANGASYATGTIATVLKEIDSIIRNEYGKIYKGSGEKGGGPRRVRQQIYGGLQTVYLLIKRIEH